MLLRWISNLWNKLIIRLFKSKCPECESYTEGMIFQDVEPYGFIAKACDNKYHRLIYKSLEKTYEKSINSNN